MAVALASVPEKRNSATLDAAARVGGMVRAMTFVGQSKLAERLGCSTRALRFQASVERGVSNSTLIATAELLEADAAEAMAIAAQLRKSAAAQ